MHVYSLNGLLWYVWHNIYQWGSIFNIFYVRKGLPQSCGKIYIFWWLSFRSGIYRSSPPTLRFREVKRKGCDVRDMLFENMT